MAAPPKSPFFKQLTGLTGTPTVVNGTLALSLTLPFLQLQSHAKQQQHHVVLLTESEYHIYTAATAQRKTTALPDTARMYLLEPTRDTGGAWSLPVLWPAGNAWRVKHGFEPVDFRIPIPPPPEGEQYLDTDNTQARVIVNGLSLPHPADMDLLDALFLRARSPTSQLHWAAHLTTTHPTSERGWARLADTAFAGDHWKLALLCYQHAFSLSTAPKRQDHYGARITACSAHTSYGPLFTPAEADHITAALPAALVQTLSAPLHMALLGEPTARAPPPLEPRVRYSTLHPRHQLPRFFSWLAPYRLCAMSTPRSADDVQVLRAKLQVTHIITLTAETPLPALWFPPAGGVRNTFVPVENYYAPTVAQMDRVLQLIINEPYDCDIGACGATLVHCGGGKGRAGTVLACCVALFGLTLSADPLGPPAMAAGAAVEAVRAMRSGSIETERQERFVASYVSLAWERCGRGESMIGDAGVADGPDGVEMELVGSGKVPDFVVLVGLQGSGKSAFARMCRLRNANVEVLSPDEIVAKERVGTASARRACEAAVGQWRGGGSSSSGAKVLVLDRCNPTPEERREWINMFNYSANITAVWFDYDADICQCRAEARGSHPTMPPHRVKSAISSTAKLLQPPTLDEGFTGVVRVRCIANAVNLANRWFGEVPMRKFVRTKHLLDLGSATRDDLVLDSNDLEGRFQKMVVVEEKVDGANIGFSLDANGKILVQNRSHYISSSDQAQFSKIDWWLEKYGPKLYRVLARDEVLRERYVLFGEWMAATHSIAYTRLPGHFLAFDLLDRLTGSFVGRDTLVALLKGSGISIVPEIYRGILEGRQMLLGFLERESLFAPGTKVEGVVVRWQNGERGKIVRENFIAGNEHWSKNEYRKNRLAAEEEEAE